MCMCVLVREELKSFFIFFYFLSIYKKEKKRDLRLLLVQRDEEIGRFSSFAFLWWD